MRIRIGTRSSQLAVWQAEHVQGLLSAINIDSELVFIKTEGDLNTDKPLHTLGGIGLFTKSLDQALLNSEIDIAVHSCKDYPTVAPDGIEMSAYLKRADCVDVLVKNIKNIKTEIIGTGSIRRTAQLLNRFPDYRVENLRGNVIKRLEKVSASNWEGGVFAKAGLDRLKLSPEMETLDWMIPAPAQGVVMITQRTEEKELNSILAKLNDQESALTSKIERSFLNVLEGGCSAPIGAYAVVKDNKVYFKGLLLTIDGKEKVEVEMTQDVGSAANLGIVAAKDVLSRGGVEIIKKLKLSQ